MTLKKEDIKKLSELTRIPVKDLTTAIEAEDENPLTFGEDIQIFTADELETRDKELAKKAGKTAIEMAVKEARNENEFDFEGKTIPNLVTAAIAKGKKAGLEEAGKKPNETIEQQKIQIEALRENIKKIEEDKDEEIGRLKSDKQKMQNNISVSSTIPADLDTVFSNRDLTNLFNVEHEVGEDEEGNQVIKKDGKILVEDKTQKPKILKQVMDEWLDDKGIKIKSNPKGRGGEDDKGKSKSELKSIKTSEDFYNYCNEHEVKHADRKQILLEVQKENPEFILE